MKRILSIVLALAMMMALMVTTASAADFTINVNIWDSNPQEGLQKIADKWTETSGVPVKIANVKINDVAQQIGINRSYLTSIFRKQVGMSPQEYLMQYRMDKAQDLLVESDISVQEIALRVGYENALTFSKIFKSYYGLSPAHYRQQKRRTEEEPG